MAESLRDQLLKSGIAKQVRDEKRSTPPKSKSRPPRSRGGPQGGAGEIDLAKAYAIRAQAEATERRRVEREAAEKARIKREQRQKIQQMLQGKALNQADADQVRHFEYSGKIRRVYVDGPQFAAINRGELGIVQQAGRYLVVTREVAEQVRAVDPAHLALLVDPNAPVGVDEDGIPDDLVW